MNMISAARRTYLNSRLRRRRRQKAGVSLYASEAPHAFGRRYILSYGASWCGGSFGTLVGVCFGEN
jgi:hypothetical protein